MLDVFRFHVPSTSLFGPGCINELGYEIARLNHKKTLIVTDTFLVELGLIKRLQEILEKSEIKSCVYDGVQPNPTVEQVENALDMYKAEGCDCLITVGGGSAHDCGKGVSILVTNCGQIKDYLGTNQTKKKGCDLFAVNTTAGTASEITTTYVLTDTKTHTKMVFEDRNCLATVAVNDPELMVSLPKMLTATTGMDAMTHAIECYTSNYSATVTSALALDAVRMIANNLEGAVNTPQDIVKRDGMSTGQYIAGMAFGNGGVGIVHSMAHQLGGVYNIPHGLANAVLLPYVVEYNGKAVANLYADIYKTICPEAQGSDAEMTEKLVEWIKDFNKKLGITSSLGELGVQEDMLGTLAEKALQDVCTATNPIEPSKDDILQIYKAAM